MKDRIFTPENIAELKENEIFVFGSNKRGNHAGGAGVTLTPEMLFDWWLSDSSFEVFESNYNHPKLYENE